MRPFTSSCVRTNALFTSPPWACLSNPADAEEVAQEAVLKAFNNLSKFRREAKFSTWLIQITINEARMRFRKDRRHLYESIDEQKSDDEGDYFPKDFADWRDIPSEELQRKELREALKRALASLDPKYREVLVLRDVQHMSIIETAKVLGITEASVKTAAAAGAAADARRPGPRHRRLLDHRPGRIQESASVVTAYVLQRNISSRQASTVW